MQQKTQRPVQFEITPADAGRTAEVDQASRTEIRRLPVPKPHPRVATSRHPAVRTDSARVGRELGLDPSTYGTHSMRRTKATLIYRRTKNLRAVQLLLGHTKLDYRQRRPMSSRAATASVQVLALQNIGLRATAGSRSPAACRRISAQAATANKGFSDTAKPDSARGPGQKEPYPEDRNTAKVTHFPALQSAEPLVHRSTVRNRLSFGRAECADRISGHSTQCGGPHPEV